MFEEPRFIPSADLVELSRFATVDQVPGHYNGLVDCSVGCGIELILLYTFIKLKNRFHNYLKDWLYNLITHV